LLSGGASESEEEVPASGAFRLEAGGFVSSYYVGMQPKSNKLKPAENDLLLLDLMGGVVAAATMMSLAQFT
jgi:hypothetical protein